MAKSQQSLGWKYSGEVKREGKRKSGGIAFASLSIVSGESLFVRLEVVRTSNHVYFVPCNLLWSQLHKNSNLLDGSLFSS